MIRNTAREIAVHLTYALSFSDVSIDEFLSKSLSEEQFDFLKPECDIYESVPNSNQRQYIDRLVKGVNDHAAELDGYIEKYSQNWRFERISLVASAIMRVAMFEILYMPDIPTGVSANEAVNIAKKYEDEQTVKFINGILGSFIKGELKE